MFLDLETIVAGQEENNIPLVFCCASRYFADGLALVQQCLLAGSSRFQQNEFECMVYTHM